MNRAQRLHKAQTAQTLRDEYGCSDTVADLYTSGRYAARLRELYRNGWTPQEAADRIAREQFGYSKVR